jgi:hypothetical protein
VVVVRFLTYFGFYFVQIFEKEHESVALRRFILNLNQMKTFGGP